MLSLPLLFLYLLPACPTRGALIPIGKLSIFLNILRIKKHNLLKL